MSLESYLLFIAAAVLLCITPGPDMAYLLSRSIAQGKRAGLMATLGINLGSYVHLLAATLGLSALLAASALGFTLVEWVGAGYLVYLGLRALFSNTGGFALATEQFTRQTDSAIFWQGFLSDVLNPKVALFFLAFLPQFISTDGTHQIWWLLALGISANVIGLAFNCLLVLFSSAATVALRRSDRIATWLNKTMGTVFIALGLMLIKQKFEPR